jgi:hypothetical protein
MASDLENAVRAGATALQAGDNATARTHFERVIQAGAANVQIWLLQAAACQAAGDASGEEEALDGALSLDPANLRALVSKGDRRDAAGDTRGAASFYDKAIKLGQGMQIPPSLASELDRAAARSRALAESYGEQLERSLAAAGWPAQARPPRFQEALDILNGSRQIYLQQPTAFYYPQLPQRQYYERDEFEWVTALEAETEVIRAELTGLLETKDGFRPYLVSDPGRPRTQFHGLNDNPEWSTLHLYENGGPVEINVDRCPRTWSAMQQVPLCHISTRAPTIMFSLLRAGARIPAHTGMINTRLICHLPLVVPRECGFRVGNEVREWEVGKLLIFDDTIEHEAWNDSDEDRVVLIFDVWRPELDAEERRAVTAIFESIDGR